MKYGVVFIVHIPFFTFFFVLIFGFGILTQFYSYTIPQLPSLDFAHLNKLLAQMVVMVIGFIRFVCPGTLTAYSYLPTRCPTYLVKV